MPKQTLRKAVVIAENRTVEVYRLKEPKDGKEWALYIDGGKTMYKSSELEFANHG